MQEDMQHRVRSSQDRTKGVKKGNSSLDGRRVRIEYEAN